MRFIILIILTAVMVFIFFPVQAEEQRLDAMAQEIQKLQNKLDKSRNKQRVLQQELEQTEREVGQLTQTLANTNDDLRQANQKLREINIQTEELEQRTMKQQQQLAQQLRSMYQMGNAGSLKLLLNQEATGKAGRMLVYYRHLHFAYAQLITEMRETLTQLAQVRDEATSQRDKLTNLQQQQQKQYDQLAQTRAYRQEVLHQMGTEIASDDQRLQQLQTEKQTLEGVVTRVRTKTKAVDTTQPFAQQKSQLPWPVVGEIDQAYGQHVKRTTLDYQGVFIKAENGAPVSAIHPGEVVFADWLNGFGLLIMIDHGEGFLSLYAHNNHLYKSRGDRVNTGDTIAGVGNSGGNTQNGLYFEIRQQGNPENPLEWCQTV